MAVYRLAAAIKSPSGDEFLVVRQFPPLAAAPEEEEYRRFVDSDLWDLPSAMLKPLEGEARSEITIQGADSISDKIDLSSFDVQSAIDQVMSQVGMVALAWSLLKYVEEAEFGPEPLVHTIYILGTLESKIENLQGKILAQKFVAGKFLELTENVLGAFSVLDYGQIAHKGLLIR